MRNGVVEASVWENNREDFEDNANHVKHTKKNSLTRANEGDLNGDKKKYHTGDTKAGMTPVSSLRWWC